MVWILVSHHGNIQTVITRQAPVLCVSETEQGDKDYTVICLYTWWCVLYFYLHTDSRPADLHKAARCVYREVCDTPAEPQRLLHVRSFNPHLFAVLLLFSAKIRACLIDTASHLWLQTASILSAKSFRHMTRPARRSL